MYVSVSSMLSSTFFAAAESFISRSCCATEFAFSRADFFTSERGISMENIRLNACLLIIPLCWVTMV